jgi:hypothetical protein
MSPAYSRLEGAPSKKSAWMTQKVDVGCSSLLVSCASDTACARRPACLRTSVPSLFPLFLLIHSEPLRRLISYYFSTLGHTACRFFVGFHGLALDDGDGAVYFPRLVPYYRASHMRRRYLLYFEFTCIVFRGAQTELHHAYRGSQDTVACRHLFGNDCEKSILQEPFVSNCSANNTKRC